MSRTLLFDRVERLMREPACSKIARQTTLSRREFARRMLEGLTLLAVNHGCASSSSQVWRRSNHSGPRVAIIGAGLAGLTCAYRLAQAGISATVYEASSRIGGRTWSTLGAQTGELGGEFIDSDHLTLLSLVRELKLPLFDRARSLESATAKDVWWISGTAIPEELLREQFLQVAPSIHAQATAVESDKELHTSLDRSSLEEWLQNNLEHQPQLRAALEIAYRGEYGLEVREQSSLNLVSLIGHERPEEFQVFGDSDERFRCARGNQSIALALSEHLGSQVQLKHSLAAVTGNAEAGYSLTFKLPDGSRSVRDTDLIVFALPFSVLRRLDLRGIPLSQTKRKVIAELGYGTHTKVISGFTRRTWRDDHHASGSVYSDLPFQQLWDSSIAAEGIGVLTTFLSGAQGAARPPEDRESWIRQLMLASAEPVFSGLSRDYLSGSSVAMHWSSYRHSLGSYSCYRPGQWAFSGTEGLPEASGTIHFCGEHTSVDFQGFMEGAAESGSLVAGAILQQTGIRPGAEHAAVLHMKRKLPQPAFNGASWTSARRQRKAQIWRAMRELSSVPQPLV